jgi:hypothetical protein
LPFQVSGRLMVMCLSGSSGQKRDVVRRTYPAEQQHHKGLTEEHQQKHRTLGQCADGLCRTAHCAPHRGKVCAPAASMCDIEPNYALLFHTLQACRTTTMQSGPARSVAQFNAYDVLRPQNTQACSCCTISVR